VSADGIHFRTGILEGNLTITRDLQRSTSWPRQELPPKKWWNIWSKAVRHVWASHGAQRTKLRASLGLWHASATHSDTMWEQYYDKATELLYEREAEGWQTYQVVPGVNRQPVCSPEMWEQETAEPPVTAVPAELRKYARPWRIIHKNRRQNGEEVVCKEVPDKFSFGQFLATRSKHVKRLLPSSAQHPEVDLNANAARLAEALKTPENKIVGASDGGLKHGLGAQGWIWEAEQTGATLTGSGPSDACAPMHSSTRTEITGLIAALTMLELVIQYHQVVPLLSTKVTLFCDNAQGRQEIAINGFRHPDAGLTMTCTTSCGKCRLDYQIGWSLNGSRAISPEILEEPHGHCHRKRG
jgi:hypothetical protein